MKPQAAFGRLWLLLVAVVSLVNQHCQAMRTPRSNCCLRVVCHRLRFA
jgi:hypothetical protein